MSVLEVHPYPPARRLKHRLPVCSVMVQASVNIVQEALPPIAIRRRKGYVLYVMETAAVHPVGVPANGKGYKSLKSFIRDISLLGFKPCGHIGRRSQNVKDLCLL